MAKILPSGLLHLREMFNLRRAGWSFRRIAREVGLSRPYVREILTGKVYGDEPLDADKKVSDTLRAEVYEINQYQSDRYNRSTEVQESVLIDMYEGGESQKDIARELGITQGAVSKRIKKLIESGTLNRRCY